MLSRQSKRCKGIVTRLARACRPAVEAVERRVLLASVSGVAWNDLNFDGVREPGEPTVAGISIQLLNDSGVYTNAGATGDDGKYSIANLLASVPYRVVFTTDSGISFTVPDAGADDARDSDVNPQTHRSAPFVLLPGEDRGDMDAGLVPFTRLTAGAYWDVNENGVLDVESDFGLAGTTLFIDFDQDGAIDDTEPSVVQSGTSPSSPLLTVPPGTWTLGAAPPATSGAWTRSTPDRTTFTIAAGQQMSLSSIAFKRSSPSARFLARVGGEVRLNQVTDGAQSVPSIGTDAAGNMVAVWVTPAAGVPTTRVVGRRFTPDGTPLGDEFVVNMPATSRTADPKVAVAPDGRFFVGWWDVNNAASVQCFRADGIPDGPPILLAASGVRGDVRLAANPNGGFVAAWTGGMPNNDDWGAFAQVFDAEAVPLDVPFRINEVTAGTQYATGVAIDGRGRITFAYAGIPESGRNYAVNGRQYSEIGLPLGPSFRVDATASKESSRSEGGLAVDAAGNAVFLWVTADSELRGRSYGPDGNPRGDEYTFVLPDTQVQPASNIGTPQAVAARDGSGFLAVWLAYNGNANANDVIGQLIGSDGFPTGRPIPLNATSTGQQRAGVLAAGTGGSYVAAWSSSVDVNGVLDDVYAQRFVTYMERSSLTGVSWRDTSGDGVRQNDEELLAGQGVALLDAAGGVVDATTTGPDGTYTLTMLRPGDSYRVRVTLPSGLLVAEPNQGGDDSRDSDAEIKTGVTAPFVAAPAGGVVSGVDVGAIASATITGNIFYDANSNGVRDAGETALSGWTVFLDDDGNGIPGPDEPRATTSAPPAGTVGYTFGSLRPGSHRVAVVPARHWRVTGPTGADALRVNVIAGQTGVAADIAAVPTSSLQDRATAVGGEALVNTTTAGAQLAPAVAADAAGNYVIVWSDAAGVRAQRFAAGGLPAGPELTVAAAGAATPAVAMAADGRFVVTWAASADIFAALYGATGAAVGDTWRVNTTTTSTQQRPDVAIDGTGAFVIVWQSSGQDSFGEGCYGQRYNANGTARGFEFRTSGTTTNNQTLPKVAVDAAGNIVVAYLSNHSNGTHVYTRRFTAADATAGPEVRVSSGPATGSGYDNVDVAMNAAGEAVVAFRNAGVTGYGIEARRYDPAGVALGDAFTVNTTTVDAQGLTGVEISDDGRFVVVWQSSGETGVSSNAGVRAQWFDGSGVRLGGEITVNTTTALNQTDPDVAMLPGGFVVTWVSDGQDGASTGIYARRFAAPPAIAAAAPLGVITSAYDFNSASPRVTFTFDADVSPVSLSLASSVVTIAPASGGGVLMRLAAAGYDVATRTVTFAAPAGTPGLPDGNYRATLLRGAVTGTEGNVTAGDSTLDFFILAGDADRDRTVGPGDFNLLATNFGKTNQTWATGDFDHDGVVGPGDFNILATRFGTTLIAPLQPSALLNLQSGGAARSARATADAKTSIATPPRNPARSASVPKRASATTHH